MIRQPTLADFCNSSRVSNWFIKITFGGETPNDPVKEPRVEFRPLPIEDFWIFPQQTFPSLQRMTAVLLALRCSLTHLSFPCRTEGWTISLLWTSQVLCYFSITQTFCTWVKNVKILATKQFRIQSCLYKLFFCCFIFKSQILNVNGSTGYNCTHLYAGSNIRHRPAHLHQCL